MASMTYDEAATERLEAVYRGSDVVRQRDHTVTLLGLKPGEHVLDIGSGPGFLCQEMAAQVGPQGKVNGVDLSPVMIARSQQRNSSPWVSFAAASATELPEEANAYDAVVATQVFEYIRDIDVACDEAFRVLKPGGRGVLLATDWDSIAWFSRDPERMTSVLQAFAGHCAFTTLPRFFSTHLRRAGFHVDRVSSYPILNTHWDEQFYSCQVIPFIAGYIRGQSLLPEAVLAEWEAEQRALAATGEYYFLSNRVFFEVSKPIT